MSSWFTCQGNGGRQQESNLPGSVWRPLLGLKPRRTTGYGCLPIRSQHVRVAHAAGVADTVEELEDLHGALTAEADAVAKIGGAHAAALARAGIDDPRELRNALAGIEETTPHLTDVP